MCIYGLFQSIFIRMGGTRRVKKEEQSKPLIKSKYYVQVQNMKMKVRLRD